MFERKHIQHVQYACDLCVSVHVCAPALPYSIYTHFATAHIFQGGCYKQYSRSAHAHSIQLYSLSIRPLGTELFHPFSFCPLQFSVNKVDLVETHVIIRQVYSRALVIHILILIVCVLVSEWVLKSQLVNKSFYFRVDEDNQL